LAGGIEDPVVAAKIAARRTVFDQPGLARTLPVIGQSAVATSLLVRPRFVRSRDFMCEFAKRLTNERLRIEGNIHSPLSFYQLPSLGPQVDTVNRCRGAPSCSQGQSIHCAFICRLN